MSELQLINRTEQRAAQVTDEVRQIKLHLAKSLLYLGQLLSEARRNNYPELLGFSSFGDWLKDSGLDMSERQAYYLIKIVDNAKSLGISREQLEASKMSKLKEIFTLDPVTQGDRIRDLVEASKDLTLEEVRSEINNLRSEVGLEPTTWMNFRVTESQVTAIKFAIEQAQLDYGQNVSETGEVTEASNGTLLADVICQGYITGRKATPPTIEMEIA